MREGPHSVNVLQQNICEALEKVQMRKIALILFGVVCLLLFSAKEAYMSGGVYTKITLDKVIEYSDVIATVRRSQPSSIVEEVPIHEDRGKFPPYKKYISIFEVVDILYKNNDEGHVIFHEEVSLFPGKTIKVLAACYDKELNLYKRYHLEGAMKTIEINRYKDYDQKLEESKECIVFLRYNENEKMLEFTAFGSIEALNKKDKIVKCLQKLKISP